MLPQEGWGLRHPPVGYLHTLATEKFEFRVIALERDFFGNYVFCVFYHDKKHENQTFSVSIEPHAPETMPILQISKKTSTDGIETSVP